jgi:putative nucleotidyltransferase with HDIG domain
MPQLTDFATDGASAADFAATTSQRLIRQTDFRMSELVAAMTAALDLTTGQPQGHSVRSCFIGMRLAECLQLSAEDRSALYYALLLKDVGCSSNAAKMSYLFQADDRLVKRQGKLIDWTDTKEALRYTWNYAAPGKSLIEKMLCLAALARGGGESAKKIIEVRCQRGADIVRQLNLPEATAQAILSLDEHYNGKGYPRGLAGEEIPLLSRVMCLAQTVEVFFTAYGLESALDVAHGRRGEWFDPQLVGALQSLRDDSSFWQMLATGNVWKEIAAYEPREETLSADEAQIDRIAEAFAGVVDAKSPWTFQHSTRVAEIAVGVAGELGCSADAVRDIRRAALLHDLGKLGVSSLILDKPGKPTDAEFAEIRKHPDYSEQILRQVSAFAPLAEVAASHHERLDGRGYHRGKRGDEIDWATRILTVADICEAMTAKRPYRDAMPWWKVQEIMERDCGSGICPDSFAALNRFQDRHQLPLRIESQLAEVERLLGEL